MSRGFVGTVSGGSGRSLRRIAGPFVAAATIATVVFGIQAPSSGEVPGNGVLRRALKIELGQATPEKWEMPLSSGIVYTLLGASGELDRRAEAALAACALLLSEDRILGASKDLVATVLI
jgi:hypothetical protein